MITYDAYRRENVKPVVGVIRFDRRSEAEAVLNALIFEADLFNRACLHSFYSACFITPDEADRSIGWTKEEVCNSEIKCRRTISFTEYRIDLPIPHPIETVEDYLIVPLWEDGHVTELAKKTFPILKGGTTHE